VIDFHCHLDLYPDPEAAVREADASRIYVLSVTTTPKAWRKTAALAKGCRRIRTALGLHPQLAHDRHNELPLFETLLPETRYIGEVGLDGSPDLRQHASIQKQVFETILDMSAKQGGRVISIHSRRAVEPVLSCLRDRPDAGVPVLHWFSGTRAQLDRAVSQGCWFSVGPAMLRSEKGRALAAAMPRDRILTETDGPFASDGTRPLNPADAQNAVNGIGMLWKVPIADVEALLLENLRVLTGHFGAGEVSTTAVAGAIARARHAST